MFFDHHIRISVTPCNEILSFYFVSIAPFFVSVFFGCCCCCCSKWICLHLFIHLILHYNLFFWPFEMANDPSIPVSISIEKRKTFVSFTQSNDYIFQLHSYNNIVVAMVLFKSSSSPSQPFLSPSIPDMQMYNVMFYVLFLAIHYFFFQIEHFNMTFFNWKLSCDERWKYKKIKSIQFFWRNYQK